MSGAAKAKFTQTATSHAFSDLACLFMIAAFPFWSTVVMTTGPFGVDTLRLANILPVVVFVAFVVDHNPLRMPDRLGRVALGAFALYLAFFAVESVRSLPNLGRMHEVDPGFPLSARAYLDEYLVVPALMAMAFVYVLTVMNSAKALDRLFSAITAGIFVEACVVIIAVVMNPAMLITPHRDGIQQLMDAVLAQHYNAIGTSFAITAPLILWLALRRGGVFGVTYFLAIVAVLLDQSRTALFAFAINSVATLLITGRARTLAGAIPVLTAIALIALGPLVVGLFALGFTEHSGFSLNGFLADRDAGIWIPLIAEWWSDHARFWYGAGNYGIVTSIMLITGNMLPVTQAHNAYLEFFLDCGIVLFGIWLILIAAFLRWGYRQGRLCASKLYWVLLVCLVSYLPMCFTGRFFFPVVENAYLFPLLAALINIARLRSVSRPDVQNPAPALSVAGATS